MKEYVTVACGQCLTESAYSVERFEVRVEGDDILISGRAQAEGSM